MTGGGVRIRASPLSTSASCPTCGVSSKRVHSRYERTLADAAIGNQPSLLVLQVRRFVCTNIDCSRATFAEQIEGLTSRYVRRTPLLRGILEKIALALAGRAGSRLASALGVSVGRSTCCAWSEHYLTLRQEWSLCSVSTISCCGDGIGMGPF
ncbi:transposase family protein [Rhodococcus globerulus]|uniref:transposase family protein n=1 Tax=Rhodococcus globerulus TaxID=33008 RepID=UPI001F1A10FE|nr:transposase family protein [Rhodococcus globerulus]